MNINTWYEGISVCQQQGAPYVLVTVISVAGSAPRNVGTKMVVTDAQSIDTIGGGHLEFDAIKTARNLLAEAKPTTKIVSYPLSAKLGQCCGGAVKLLFEVCNQHTQHVAIFGAGHVAKALVPILSQLPLRISWIDARSDAFDIPLPANVTRIVEQAPETEVRTLAENSWLIILTHDHQLDYRITEQALKFPSFPFVGLIGSKTKAKRFITKLRHKGFDDKALTRLVTPIGDLSIPGKRPIEVAVSIASQIIKRLHAEEDDPSSSNIPSKHQLICQESNL